MAPVTNALHRLPHTPIPINNTLLPVLHALRTAVTPLSFSLIPALPPYLQVGQSNQKRLDVITLQRYALNMSAKTKRATIYMDPELHRVLRLKAAEVERSISDLVNDAVRRSLFEDARDLAEFELRTAEASLGFEEVLKDLKARGKI